MSLCICAVSPELSVLIYKLYDILVTKEASDGSVHLYSLTRAFSFHLQTIWHIGGPEKVQMSLCICSVSPELSLLIYKLYDILVTREG